MSEDVAPVGPPPSGLRRTAESTLGLPPEDEVIAMSPIGHEQVSDLESQTPMSRKALKEQIKTEKKRHKTAMEEVITVDIDDFPRGYPQLAAFTGSDQDFMLFRGFSNTRVRLLLHLQTDIADLELELHRLDSMQWSSDSNETNDRLMWYGLDKELGQQESSGNRQELLERLQQKLSQYDELLIRTKEINGFQKPVNQLYQSVRNWIHGNAPLMSTEQEYILRHEDIVSLRTGKESAKFDALVESLLHRMPGSLIMRLFARKGTQQANSGMRIYYTSPARIAALVNFIIAGIIIVLMATPICIMYKLSTFKTERATYASIGVLVLFTIIFSSVLALVTNAGRHELFTASAAYCAVLVVFIGSTST